MVWFRTISGPLTFADGLRQPDSNNIAPAGLVPTAKIKKYRVKEVLG